MTFNTWTRMSMKYNKFEFLPRVSNRCFPASPTKSISKAKNSSKVLIVIQSTCINKAVENTF